MITLLLILHAFVTVAMIGLILLQKSDEAGPLGMGGGGGNNALFTARGVANILTRATSFLAALFIGNCLLIATITSKEAKGIDFVEQEKKVTKKNTPEKSVQKEAMEGAKDEPSQGEDKSEKKNSVGRIDDETQSLLKSSLTDSTKEENRGKDAADLNLKGNKEEVSSEKSEVKVP